MLEAIRRGTAPAALLTAGTDSFLALTAIVADEMYGHAPPVVALTDSDFDKLIDGRSARVGSDGTVVME